MEWRRWQDLRDRVLLADGSIREVADVREAIQARGAELRYLPPHSLDTTRSSRCSLRLKALLRKASARTVDALWPVIGTLLEHFPAAECKR